MKPDAAMNLAIEQAELIKGTTYPNPPVGAVILNQDGEIVGIGATQPTNGLHAEIVALKLAGFKAVKGTMFVTLEPCSHYGRTPPCVDEIINSGLSKVVYAVPELNLKSKGGAQKLIKAGLIVYSGLLAEKVKRGILREWLYKQYKGTPHLTWKLAISLDGKTSAKDGSSKWITNELSRIDCHMRRYMADVVIIGTNTALTDDSILTARRPDKSLTVQQPLRVVVGMNSLPVHSKVLNDDACTMLIKTHNPYEVMQILKDYTDIFLEGGPTIAEVFLRNNLINRILAYVAPILLGGKRFALKDSGVSSIIDAKRWNFDYIESIGPDIILSIISGPIDSIYY